jgi:hypothetical protein
MILKILTNLTNLLKKKEVHETWGRVVCSSVTFYMHSSCNVIFVILTIQKVLCYLKNFEGVILL